MERRILIIGAGKIGRAVASVLEHKDIEISFWDKDPAKTRTHESLARLVKNAEIIFLCVPSWSVRKVLKKIKTTLSQNTRVIALSKGLETKTMKTIAEVLEEHISSRHNRALLSGPMLADELVEGEGGSALIATKSRKIQKEVKELFKETTLDIKHTKDMQGTAVAAVLKNIYAIACGISDGLRWGSNMKGHIINVASGEMPGVIRDLGGRGKTALTDAGLGDLIATGFGEESRNRQAGVEIAKTGRCCLESEGTKSLPLITDRLGNNIKHYPLLNALGKIIIHGENPKNSLEKAIRENR